MTKWRDLVKMMDFNGKKDGKKLYIFGMSHHDLRGPQPGLHYPVFLGLESK